MLHRFSNRLSLAAASLAILISASPGISQKLEAEDPAISIASVVVSPATPAADTLCRLAVTLVNRGDQVASQLGFEVEINGKPIPVYSNQLFMYPLQPGATEEISLFNFWSTETSRPFPADGKLRVEVTLTEAQWTAITEVEGVETWTPEGPVPGLPVSEAITLEMTR